MSPVKKISSTFKEEKTANYEWSPGIQRGNTERHLEVALHNFCVSIHNEITSTDWNIYVSFAFGFVTSHATYVTNVSVKYLLQNVNSHLPAPSVSRTFPGG